MPEKWRLDLSNGSSSAKRRTNPPFSSCNPLREYLSLACPSFRLITRIGQDMLITGKAHRKIPPSLTWERGTVRTNGSATSARSPFITHVRPGRFRRAECGTPLGGIVRGAGRGREDSGTTHHASTAWEYADCTRTENRVVMSARYGRKQGVSEPLASDAWERLALSRSSHMWMRAGNGRNSGTHGERLYRPPPQTIPPFRSHALGTWGIFGKGKGA